MRVAITGGIGSGKSTVLEAAREMGLSTLSADEINDSLLESPEYITQIASLFPDAVEDGKINKKTLAQIVFSDDGEREKLNAVAHPQILKRIECAEGNPLIVEMPLLLESGAEGLFDEIVLVRTPLIKRIYRLQKRGFGTVEALKRMCVQVGQRQLKKVATRILDNSGSIGELKSNAVKLFLEMLGI